MSALRSVRQRPSGRTQRMQFHATTAPNTAPRNGWGSWVHDVCSASHPRAHTHTYLHRVSPNVLQSLRHLDRPASDSDGRDRASQPPAVCDRLSPSAFRLPSTTEGRQSQPAILARRAPTSYRYGCVVGSVRRASERAAMISLARSRTSARTTPLTRRRHGATVRVPTFRKNQEALTVPAESDSEGAGLRGAQQPSPFFASFGAPRA